MSLNIITIISLGIATNLDNVIIGVAYGLAGKQIGWRRNLLVSAISGAFALAACAAAHLVTHAYAALFMTAGALLLIALGAYGVYAALKGQDACPGADVGPASLKETAVLGVTLALNCLAASFGVGLGGGGAVGVGISVTAFSFLAVALGNWAGVKTKRAFSARWLNIVSGFLLVLMGIWELFI